MTINKSHKEWLLSRAFLYIQNQRYSEAVILLEALNLLSPDEAQTQKALAVAYLNNHQHEKALNTVEILISSGLTADEIKTASIIKSRALWRMGYKQQARQALHLNSPMKSRSFNPHNIKE